MPRSIQVGVPSGWVLSILIVILPRSVSVPDVIRGHRHFRPPRRAPAAKIRFRVTGAVFWPKTAGSMGT